MKTPTLPHSISIPAGLQAAAGADYFKEMRAITERFLDKFQTDIAPLAEIQPPLAWESWTAPPSRSRPDDMPEWLFREIAHGSY